MGLYCFKAVCWYAYVQLSHQLCAALKLQYYFPTNTNESKVFLFSSFAAYGDVCVSMCCHHPPFCYISGGLEEASVVVLLQALLGLCDEGAGALQTLATVCNLLSQLAQLHHLEDTQIQNMLLCSDTLIYIHPPALGLEGTLFCWLDASNFCLSNEDTDENTNCTFPDLVQIRPPFFFFFSYA